MNKYKVKCERGYALMNESLPRLDQSTEYFVVDKSKYFDNCVIIKRVDGNKYLGNDTWIVPESCLKLIVG